jgi:glycosyltransferase involved in cell wall biosynthesis
VNVSVVIPTCNRQPRLLALLASLARSEHPLLEVIVVDSSDDKMPAGELAARFPGLALRYLESEKSVCVQRNRGIQAARGDWIFLCDDDLEVPPDYLAKLAAHARAHPEAGAISGFFLERQDGRWESQHPVTSARSLVWRYLFGLSLWGEIRVRGLEARAVSPLVERYRRQGNHISRAGWPVITDFSAPFFRTPIYSLGASLVRRDWLLGSPYDELLDPHGFGDNYGVAIGFPGGEGIHIVTGAFVHHHKEDVNRLPREVAYARRVLAIHYYLVTRPAELAHVKLGFLLWSLAGQTVFHALKRNLPMARAASETMLTIIRGKNPYLARRAEAAAAASS